MRLVKVSGVTRPVWVVLLMASKRVTPRSRRDIGRDGQRSPGLAVHDCQRLTPAGEFACDRDVGDHGPLLPGRELHPLPEQSFVAGLPAQARVDGCLFPSDVHDGPGAGPVVAAVWTVLGLVEALIQPGDC